MISTTDDFVPCARLLKFVTLRSISDSTKDRYTADKLDCDCESLQIYPGDPALTEDNKLRRFSDE